MGVRMGIAEFLLGDGLIQLDDEAMLSEFSDTCVWSLVIFDNVRELPLLGIGNPTNGGGFASLSNGFTLRRPNWVFILGLATGQGLDSESKDVGLTRGFGFNVILSWSGVSGHGITTEPGRIVSREGLGFASNLLARSTTLLGRESSMLPFSKTAARLAMFELTKCSTRREE